MTIWEMLACIDGYSIANGANVSTFTIDDYEQMKIDHADFFAPSTAIH